MKHEKIDISNVESLNLNTPKGYREFIRWVIKYADYFCLTYEGFDYYEFTKSKWSYLIDSLIRYESSFNGAPIVILYLRFDYVTIEYLKSKKSIFDFWDIEEAEGGREFLWDLGFVKEGKQFFETITHEGYYWFK